MSTRKIPAISPLFLLLTSTFVTCLILSNIIAGKLITVFGIPLPAAVILFPITYIFGDILTEVYGFERARLAIWCGFFANLLMAAVFMLTVVLPHPAFWKDQAAYQTVLGFAPRLVLASLLGYWGGEFANSVVLSKMKRLTRGRRLWMRTLGSTAVGEGIDTLVFITIAFWGLMPPPVLGTMILAQYLWKVCYEALATPLTYWAVNRVKRHEGLDVFDDSVSYNPFSLEVRHEP
ncbi:hypothetical protein EDC14_103656 [Hydrogenispora ethanolica]|jgi:uncharacterized integral membrane protein (TIGR00697 family)|uniref:Probable queuosine precursor transporter n=1 Tax=Hydrogenispora ethanolica TaxID=1082276 RepID=A0A4R1R4V8_HYDET|nr:queuosine precursor transporter [Hydrogenispora ethanolica]TCL60302.1 hypothetical protein EDC14_103656 [Hydrogenispora ethanolica]